MSKKEFEPSEDQEAVRIKRREYRRVAVRLGVTLTSDSNFYVGFADNISEGGLFVATQQHVDVGTTVDLEIGLPDGGELLEATALVRWQRANGDPANGILPGFGASFIEIADEDRARLEAFIESREPLFYPE